MSNRKVEIKSSQARIKRGLFFKEQTFIKSKRAQISKMNKTKQWKNLLKRTKNGIREKSN